MRLRGNLVFYGVAVLVTAVSLFVLFRLQRSFEQTLEQRISDLQRVFSNRALLKTPSDPKIVFADVEIEVAKYEHQGDFGRITITKRFGNRDQVIYPFYSPAIEANSVSETADFRDTVTSNQPSMTIGSGDATIRTLQLIADGVRLGSLSVNVKQGPLRTVRFVITALSVLLAASLALLALQFRRQEHVISRTTIELEAKRKELVRLERLSLAGQLSANILHDLKKPVLNIKNEVEEAMADTEGGTSSAEGSLPAATSMFGDSVDRIKDQVELFFGILRESSIDRFVRAKEDREFVDVNGLLDKSLALVRYERNNMEVQKIYDPKLQAVFAEPVRLVQLFSNLILNAYQAGNGKGLLTVRTRASPGWALVEIEDNGTGISPELKEKIFEPFYTTKQEGQGTGLGLYIGREIVSALGGSIEVESNPGKTIFRITLPENQ